MIISVIVPIYNMSNYLRKCIDSICSQSFQNIEIILVDDGSTDNSGDICDQYQSVDDRIKVIHQDNMGLVAARKAGLAIATGDYIGFVDSDDWIETNMYERLLFLLSNSNADFVHSCYIENNNVHVGKERVIIYNEIDNTIRMSIIRSILSGEAFGEMEYSISPSIWSKLYRKDFITKCYKDVPDYQSYGEDVISLCSCILNSNGFIYTTASYYHYLVREDSMSNKAGRSRLSKEFSLYNCLKELFLKYDVAQEMELSLDQRLDWCMIRHLNDTYGDWIEDYYFPSIEDFFGKKIVIYGAGRVGRSIYKQFKLKYGDNITAWIDKRALQNDRRGVLTPNKLCNVDYDAIIVAVEKKEVAEDIIFSLKNEGVKEGQIVWRRPKRILENI